MRSLLAAALVLSAFPAFGADQIVILGDSLSKEYEFSFQLDGFENPETVRNWIEVLHAERNESFDMGSRIEVDLFLFEIFFRHRYNWAVPGAKVPQISSFLRGEIGFADFFTSEGGTEFEEVLSDLVGLIDEQDFDVDELDDQLRNSAERVVLLVGGNDADEVYREIYEDDPSFDAEAWIDNFLTEAAFIMDWVLERNASIPFVVVALPHVGITPTVKASHPPDPVKTGRVTAVMRELNRELETLARERGIAFADIFEPMLRLLDPNPACLHGIPFVNDIPPPGEDPGALDYFWLNGTASDGFHPNTNGQLIIANEVVRAFNEYYDSGIAPLTATEMLQDWLGKDPDVTFSEWLSCYGLEGADAFEDSDLDGMPAALEFAVGGDPLRRDPWHLRFSLDDGDAGDEFVMAYRLRLPGSSRVMATPQISSNLKDWDSLTLPANEDPDGFWRVRLPITSDPSFLRLQATIP